MIYLSKGGGAVLIRTIRGSTPATPFFLLKYGILDPWTHSLLYMFYWKKKEKKKKPPFSHIAFFF